MSCAAPRRRMNVLDNFCVYHAGVSFRHPARARRHAGQWRFRIDRTALVEAGRYLPTMMIVKEPGTGAPRPPPRPPAGGAAPSGTGGGGPTSDAIAKRWPVLLSNAIVRAPFDGHVFRSCSTSKLVGLFSLTIVIVPLPCVLKASIVCGLNAAPSEPPASGRRVRIVPSFALRITNVWGGLAFGSGLAGGPGAGGCPGVPRAGAGPTALQAANRI